MLLLSKMMILVTLNKIFKKIGCLCYVSAECRFFYCDFAFFIDVYFKFGPIYCWKRFNYNQFFYFIEAYDYTLNIVTVEDISSFFH